MGKRWRAHCRPYAGPTARAAPVIFYFERLVRPATWPQPGFAVVHRREVVRPLPPQTRTDHPTAGQLLLE